MGMDPVLIYAAPDLVPIFAGFCFRIGLIYWNAHTEATTYTGT